MADRIEIRNITIPAGTPQVAPQVTNLVWRQGYPVRVEIRFPPGPSGLVGIKLRHSGVEVVPKDGSAFLVSDNEIIGWDLEMSVYTAKWSAVTYNEGQYPHTLQIRMLLNEISRPTIQRTASGPIVLPTLSSGNLLEGLEA